MVLGEGARATTVRSCYEAAAEAFTRYAETLPKEDLSELAEVPLAGPIARRLKGRHFRPRDGDTAALMRRTNALRLKLQKVRDKELRSDPEFTVLLGATALCCAETVSVLFNLKDRATACEKAAEVLRGLAESGLSVH